MRGSQAPSPGCDRHQLVDSAQGRMVGRGDEVRPYSPGVDGRPLPLEIGDEVLVQLVRGHDERVIEPGLGEHPPGCLAEPGEVAGVESDRCAHRPAGCAQLLEHGDRVGQPRGQRVVGVDEQDGVGIAGRIGAEGLELVLETHHPGVGMRALYRDAEDLAGEHVRRAVGATDVCGPGAAQPAVGPLGPAQAELHQVVVRHRPAGCAPPWWRSGSGS